MMEVIMNNLEASQEAEAAGGAAAGGVAKNESGLGSETLFNMMAAYCDKGEAKDAIKKANGVFGFDITLKKG